jgi:hypothetical protein
MQEGKSLQSRSENVSRFCGSQRALREKLGKIFLGVFHEDIKQIEVTEAATAGFEDAQQVWMGKRGCMLPAKELKFGVWFIDLDKFDRGFLRRSAAFCQKNSAVLRAAEIAAKREFGVDNLAFPLFPRFGHNAPSSA